MRLIDKLIAGKLRDVALVYLLFDRYSKGDQAALYYSRLSTRCSNLLRCAVKVTCSYMNINASFTVLVCCA